MTPAPRPDAAATSQTVLQGRQSSLTTAGFVAFMVGLGFLIYAPALGAGFIWDDGRAITDNSALRSLHGLWRLWAGQAEADYFPLKSTVLWLLYRLFGARTSPYHILHVAVHAANAVLLWRVLRRLSIPGAWLAGLVFLVHPTHVESVAWVSECKNTLSTLFALLALLAWFGYQDHRRGRDYVVSLVLFVGGLLCKTHVVILPMVLVLCAWWQRRPDRQAPSDVAGKREGELLGVINPFLGGLVIVIGIVAREFWLATILCLGVGSVGILSSFLARRFAPFRFILRTLAFFQVAVLFGAVTVWFQYGTAIGDYQLPVGGMSSRVANAGKATWWYLAKAISPVSVWYEMPDRPIETEPEAQAFLAGTRSANPAPAWPRGKLTVWPLVTIYPRWRVTPPLWYDFIPAIAMLALFAWAAKHREGRGRGTFFALAYFLIALLPVVGLLKMSYMRAAWVADHFQYLADIGIIALACAAGTLLWRKATPAGRWPISGAAVVLIGSFAAGTFVRAGDYHSEYTLWTDTVAKNPGAWQAQVRLGAALLVRGDVRAATVHFGEAVRLKPDEADARNNLGLGLVSEGQVADGIAQYRESIRLKDAAFSPHANLAEALAGQKLYPEAIAEYRAALRRNPALVSVMFRLGSALVLTGKLDEAIDTFESAKRRAPNSPEITAALADAMNLRASAR
jgi:tetratricopeptide (TPR) repeat protein